MNGPRKTQFTKYAACAYKDLRSLFSKLLIDGDKSAEQAILDALAENAYDLVGYTISHVEPKDLGTLEYEECLHRIPDSPVLPIK